MGECIHEGPETEPEGRMAADTRTRAGSQSDLPPDCHQSERPDAKPRIWPAFRMVEAAGIEPASWSSEGEASTRVSQVLVLASGRSPERDRLDASPLAFPADTPGQGASK